MEVRELILFIVGLVLEGNLIKFNIEFFVGLVLEEKIINSLGVLE